MSYRRPTADDMNAALSEQLHEDNADHEAFEDDEKHEFEESLNWWKELHGLCGVCNQDEDAAIHRDELGNLL